jgi:hypothetical protein
MIGFHIFGEKLLIVHDREDAEQLVRALLPARPNDVYANSCC